MSHKRTSKKPTRAYNKRYTSALVDGDDIAAWLKVEIPTWTAFPVKTPADSESGDAGDGVSQEQITSYRALSPSYDEDGIQITAATPDELVDRVRALERMIAMLMGRSGDVAVGHRIAGQDIPSPERADPGEGVTAPPLIGRPIDPPPAAQSPSPAPAAPSVAPNKEDLNPTLTQYEISRVHGYTGDPCPTCGSLTLVRNGNCLCCRSCGNTTGCS